MENNVSIYNNSTGSLDHVEYLQKDQVYPRIADFGADRHQIPFGHGYGYIWKESTIPGISNNPLNLNSGIHNTNRVFTAMGNLTVYENSTGNLIPNGSINKNHMYTSTGKLGNDWLEVAFSERICFVYKPPTEIISSTIYGKTIVLDTGHGGRDSGAAW